ncbi:ribosome silencing factor [Bariatricus sp. SGI.154]|uniref:ribosome silencing factor n=1 Tax=Bariatricus sp. SGI.154 TaxID=3420549 RepID=UPI003D05F8D1
MEQTKEMVRIAYEALDEKKGEDIRIIEISGISVLADYFIITNGTSDSQVKALVEHVEEKMHKAGYAQKQREGVTAGNWVLLDYGDVIVHVFDKDNREFYNLERIWNDGKKIEDLNEL